MENFLQEAFKRLSLLEDDFNYSELDKDKIDELQSFVPDDVEVPETEEIDVIDTEADNESELEDIYEGKIILECECCHSRIYKNKEDVVITNGVANEDEACPVCGNALGFTVIGKIEAFDPDKDIKAEAEKVEEPADDESIEEPDEEPTEEVEDEESEEKEESLKSVDKASEDSKKLDENKRPIKESIDDYNLPQRVEYDLNDFTVDINDEEAVENAVFDMLEVDYGVAVNYCDASYTDNDTVVCYNIDWAVPVDEAIHPDLQGKKPVKGPNSYTKTADPAAVKKVFEIFDSMDEEDFNFVNDNSWEALFDRNPESLSGIRKIFKKYRLPMWALEAFVENWDEGPVDEKLNAAEAARLAEITKDGIVKSCDREEYKELHDKELEESDDVCPVCGKNPCTCDGLEEAVYDATITDEGKEQILNSIKNNISFPGSGFDGVWASELIYGYGDVDSDISSKAIADVASNAGYLVYKPVNGGTGYYGDVDDYLILPNKGGALQDWVIAVNNEVGFDDSYNGIDDFELYSKVNEEFYDNKFDKDFDDAVDALEKSEVEKTEFEEVKEDLAIEPAQEVVISGDCVEATATNVMAAYQNANKWLDIIKEFAYTNLGCVFFSSYIHNLAHTMPVRFDAFGDILHTINMRIPYPETPYIPQEPSDVDGIFTGIFMVLDSIKNSLNEFIKCTDEQYHGMACAAEGCLNDIEGEYPTLFRLQQEWTNCGGDLAKFDKYVGQYIKEKENLTESLNEENIPDPWSDIEANMPESDIEVIDLDEDLDNQIMVKVTNIDYDTKGEEVNLPAEFEFNIDLEEGEEKEEFLLEYELADRIFNETGFKPNNFEYEVEDLDESINEDINIESPVDVTVEEDGKVTVEPVKEETELDISELDSNEDAADEGGEEIVPLDSAEISDIEANGEETPEEAEEPEELSDEDEEDFEDFDEEEFDNMGESFVRKVYENVDSFKTTAVKASNEEFIIEGNINFKSGNTRNTKFVFNNKRNTKSGKVIFEGYNKTFSNNKNTFILKGVIDNNKYIPSVFKYDYSVKQINESNESEVLRIQGRINAR